MNLLAISEIFFVRVLLEGYSFIDGKTLFRRLEDFFNETMSIFGILNKILKRGNVFLLVLFQ